MNENIFDKRRIKTFSNCKDLVKSMVGTREGMIVYNEKFRIDLENTCYKASICEDLSIENQQLKDRINKAIFYMKNYISVEEYNEPVKCEFGIVIKLLKGDKE